MKMKNNYEYYKKFNWSSNPFILSISPDLMVGYSSQIESLFSHIFNLHKIALIIGHTGSGKTTLLQWINNNVNDNDGFQSFYIPKPPKDTENLILLFKSLFGHNFLDKLRANKLSTTNTPHFLVRKTRNKKTILLIDESHECTIEVLEWLRTFNDLVPNISMIFAGLPVFENMIETKIPTLSMRITTKTYLKSLNDAETESLIRKRIENVGGRGLDPFTSDSITMIYKITGGFPREIIKVCDKLIRESAKRNISSINKTLIDQTLEIHTPKILYTKTILSKKQEKIMAILNKKPNLTPSMIVENLDTKSYKNKDNAVRSVNNILRRLMKEQLIGREKISNSYVYFLSGKAKTIFAEA